MWNRLASKLKSNVGDYGTDNLNVRIFEVVAGKVKIVLDTVVYAAVSNKIILTGYDINENCYISVSRGLDFAAMQSVQKDEIHGMIIDYNCKNSEKTTEKLDNKKYRSRSFIARLCDLRKEETKKAELFSIDEAITVYPNPSYGDVNINIDANISGGVLDVYYVNQGSNENELVYTIKLENGVSSYKINRSALNRNGTYMIVGGVDYKEISHAIEPIPFMIVK